MKRIVDICRGVYISVEGVGGSGKTFYLRQLEENHKGAIVVATELSTTGLGAGIVALLRSSGDEFFRHGYPLSEALLLFAAKLFELDRSILPALEQDMTVVEDRSADSNCLYSAILIEEKYGGDWFEHYMTLMEIRSKLAPIPTKVLCLVPDLDKAVRRMEQRDRRSYSSSEIDFISRVNHGFVRICSEDSRRFVRLDVDTLAAADVMAAMERFVGL